MVKRTFDRYAGDYDAALARGLEATGEDASYFVKGRIAFLQQCLRQIRFRPRSILDFGCGTGATSPALADALRGERVVGVDVSERSLTVARANIGREGVTYLRIEECRSTSEFDLAYCNGVFHHIPLHERRRAVEFVRRSLKPGGIFAFWENNPWNPGVRYVMSRTPFDSDARVISPMSARELLGSCGFEILRIDFQFVFPRLLGRLRWSEPLLARLPIGGQYQVLCRKGR